LKLLKDNFHPGDKIVETKLTPDDDIAAQAFLTPTGKKLLLVNKRNRSYRVNFPGSADATKIFRVDESTGENPARESQAVNATIELAPFAVVVVSW
jgi:hypothetical protein